MLHYNPAIHFHALHSIRTLLCLPLHFSLFRTVPSYLQVGVLASGLATLTLAGQVAFINGSARFDDDNAGTATSVFEPLEAAASPQAWMQQGWNGLTTFAGAAPMRCFGADGSILYDVAVLGMNWGVDAMRICFTEYPLGAPFDTATTYRSGSVLSFGEIVMVGCV